MSESCEVSQIDAMEDANRYPSTLDATARCALTEEQGTPSINVVRRSTSIFSRRGTTTLEPTSLVLADAVDRSKDMSAKRRSWVLRRRSRGDPLSMKNGYSKPPRGTVLHAVPPADMTRLSALEEEMTQSPNDEILSAISRQSSNPFGPTTPSCSRVSYPHESKTFYPSKANSRRDASSRIGVWVDGVVHWNGGSSAAPSAGHEVNNIRSSVPGTQAFRQQKPCLWVTIPTSELQPSARTIYQPQPHRVPTSHSVGPLIDRPHAPIRRSSPVSRSSRSSTSSGSIDEGTSICSNRSSTTSIEASASIPVRTNLAPISTRSSLYMHQYACNAVNDLTANDHSAGQHRMSLTPQRVAPCAPFMRDRPAFKTQCTAPSIRLVHPQDTTISPPHTPDASTTSPTWSQAEHDLQRELSTEHDDHDISDSSGAIQRLAGGSLRRSGSVSAVMQPPDRAPTIPKRSRKRDWVTHAAYVASELQRHQSEMWQEVSGLRHGNAPLRKSASVSCSARPIAGSLDSRQFVPQPPEQSTPRPLSNVDGSGVHQNLVLSRRKAIAAAMMPTASAEDVLLHILARLRSPQDLFNTAIINKGMFRVFQENDIQLFRLAVFNESPALWELLEWSPSNGKEVKSADLHAHAEHSPTPYMRCYRREKTAMRDLKRLILQTCQTFLRRETVIALSTPTHPNAQRFDDAFWRIWTFCRVFGSVKNREDDITGQMDWLRGGVLANNEDCIASTDPNMDFDLSSVLIAPPAYFAESNRGGLSASQLFDMTEMWTCMTALLQGYHGRVGQARYYGVFDQCEVEEGDIENEAVMLEEWTASLQTLGPDVVLEMAQLYPAAGFALARDNGWTRWTPSIHNGSRSSFLKEPVAKSYEEQVIVAKQRQKDPREQVRKDASRRRVATLAAEIRVRRQSSAYKRSPMIDMTTERAMSMSSRRDSVSPTREYRSREASRRISSAPTVLSMDPRKSNTIVADRMEAYNRQDIVASAVDTGERAIQQLVTMGFEREMAVDALRITDRGDGLRPDRAIDLLLRQQE